ncbi:M16 family metallopeptidase [Qingshengfaniella alkalisoli]|uniref:Insulinase family protein n=1 Tax=Qingshengfaniella alkalisoli TaxID=2599296 RepID=A0A5B8IZ99_9RHOB|nr:pitrilysin family protein [Qingshengfaniella alkalisoli]QDY69938.1 insulinase family protein [Qingshengfaniella alkalisoli]
MLRSLATGLILSIAANAAGAEEVTQFTLDNGMDVVVIEDHRAPVVVNMVWYRVGAADEVTGKSGIAHFLEHLMFKGTDELASGEFSQIVKENGGMDNAFTSWDYTAYFQRVAADRLDLMMQMEADRMTDLQLTDAEVTPERSVILEERSQRTDSDPSALFREQTRAAQYLNHPYGRPVIGWRHEMEGLTTDDALTFYRRYYAPNNAILVVAGDVTPDDVRTMAETHFGPIPENPDLPERTRPEEPPQIAARRLVYHDARVAQPYLTRSYLAPERDSGAQEQAAALTYLADLLGGGGITSYLGQRLQLQEKSAIYTGAYYGGVSLDASTFSLVLVPSDGVSLEQSEAELDEALADFMDEGVDVDRFERIKRNYAANAIYQQDSTRGLANDYGAALASGLTVQDVQDWPAILQDVTPDDVMDAARAILDPTKSVTGWLLPEDMKTAQEAAQ